MSINRRSLLMGASAALAIPTAVVVTTPKPARKTITVDVSTCSTYMVGGAVLVTSMENPSAYIHGTITAYDEDGTLHFDAI